MYIYQFQVYHVVFIIRGIVNSWVRPTAKTTKIGSPRIKSISQYLYYSKIVVMFNSLFIRDTPILDLLAMEFEPATFRSLLVPLPLPIIYARALILLHHKIHAFIPYMKVKTHF